MIEAVNRPTSLMSAIGQISARWRSFQLDTPGTGWFFGKCGSIATQASPSGYHPYGSWE